MLCFATVNACKTIVFPHSMTVYDFAKENYLLKKELDILK